MTFKSSFDDEFNMLVDFWGMGAFLPKNESFKSFKVCDFNANSFL